MAISIPIAATADDRSFQRIGDELDKWSQETGKKIGSGLAEGIDDPKVQKAFDKVSDAMSKLRAEEAKLQDLRDRGASQSRIVVQAESVTRARNAERRAVNDVVRAYDDLHTGTGRLSNITGVLTETLSGTRFGELADQVEVLTGRFGGLGFATGAVVTGVAGIAVGAVAATKALYYLGARWDSIGDSITQRTGIVGDDLDSLMQAVSDVGDTTAASLESIGDVVGRLAQSMPDLIATNSDAFRQMASNLAYLNDAGQSVDIKELGMAFRVFNVDVNDQVKALDDLNSAAQVTGIPIDTLIGTVRSGAPQFRQFGLDLGQSTSLLAQFDQAGVSSEIAATGLRTALKKLGTQGGDASIALVGVVDKIKMLHDSQQEGAAQQLAQDTFGTKNAAAFLQVIETGVLDIKTLNNSINNVGDSIEEQKQKTEDWSESWQKIKNQVGSGLKTEADMTFATINQWLETISSSDTWKRLTSGRPLLGPFSEGDLPWDQAIPSADLNAQRARRGRGPVDPTGGFLGNAGDPALSQVAPGGRPPGIIGNHGGIGGSDLSDKPNLPYWGYPDKSSGGSSGIKQAEVPYGAKPGISQGVPLTTEVYGAQASLWEAQHNTEEKRARLQQLEQDNNAKAEDLIRARNDVAKAESDQLSAQMQFQKTQQDAYEKQFKQLKTAADGMDQIGAALDNDFGVSKGLPGIAENLTKFLANLAFAPVIGAMKGAQAGLGYPNGAAGSGLFGMVASSMGMAGSPSFGDQSTATPSGIPGVAIPGVLTGQPYGLPAGTDTGGYGSSGPVFPQWVHDIEAAFGVKASTYSGHQESDRNEPGYAPNPGHENRGIDWSGSPQAMQAFADYLKTVPGMEQVIWNGAGAGTGDNVEIAGGRPQPGYFAGDLAAHGNHVHTRQSQAIPLPGGMSSSGPGGIQGASPSGGATPVFVVNMPGGGMGGGGIPGIGGQSGSPGASAGDSLWDKVAQAESGGNWQNNDTGQNGHYGGLQFSPSTWKLFGGDQFAAMPNLATREQQIEIANRTAFNGYNGVKPQGLGAWEAITKGMVPGVSVNTPAGAFGVNPSAPGAGGPALPSATPTAPGRSTGGWAGPLPSGVGGGGGQSPFFPAPTAPGAGGPGVPGIGGAAGGPGFADPSSVQGGREFGAGTPASGGINFSGGILGAAMSGASSAAGMAASGAAMGMDGGMGGAAASAAMQIGIQEASRAAAAVGQYAGVAVGGLLETFSLNDSALADPGKSWLGKLAMGVAGARPAMPNSAGGKGGKENANTKESGTQKEPPGPLDPQAAKKAQAGGDLNSTDGKSAVGSNGDKSGITINYTNNQATEDRAGADIAGHLSSMQLAGTGG